YTFCMIEHDIEFIGKLCDSVIVMAEGSVLATDNIEAIKSNPEVIDAYLGRGMKNKS
ncbi:MAG: ABC transporter ATP-binding protein, partial [Alphaproteobacteria bacterium]|nr:ABC transporter ATP-binding protein [Alphaproteobacteria bacterium]